MTEQSQPPAPDAGGRPGSGTFSIEGRPAAGLYLVGWLLSGLGLAVLFVAGFAQVPARGLLVAAGGLLLVLGLASAAGYQLVARRSRPPGAYRGPSPLIVFGLFLALVNLLALFLLALGVQGIETPQTFLLGVGVQTLAYFVVVWLFVVRPRAIDWREMGLPVAGERWRAFADAAFAVGVMAPVTLLALIGGGIVAQLLDARPPTVVPTPDSGPAFIAVALGAAILAPIGEEIFFRGFALTAWLRDLGPRSALVRSSFFFALVHIANIQVESTAAERGDGLALALRQALVILAVILPVGGVLGWLYLQRGLVAPIVGHVTYNAILVVLLALSTQLPPVPPR